MNWLAWAGCNVADSNLICKVTSKPTRKPLLQSRPRQQRATCQTKHRELQETARVQLPQAQEAKGSCYGCGTPLQTTQPGTAGYVTPERYAVKLQRRQLNLLICERCQALSHGQMLPAVQDFSNSQQGSELAGKALVSPQQLRAQLQGLAQKRILALLVVDLLDCSGSFLNHVRDLVGKNPILLVGTKADLLPKGTHFDAITDWLLNTAAYRRLNVVNAFLVGSPKGQGVDQVASAVLRERKGRDVYVLGAANVGKSSFVRALMREMSQGDSRYFQGPAKAQSRQLPVESAMPGTTLQTIQLQAFTSGGALYDTPGVHLHHRLPHMLTPAELKQLHPLRRLVPYFPPSPAVMTDIAAGDDQGSAHSDEQFGSDQPAARSVSATYQWGGIARVDVVSAPYGTGLAFLGPPALAVHALPLLHPDELVQSDPPTGSLSVSPRSSASEASSPAGAQQQPELMTYSTVTRDVVSAAALRTQAETADLDRQWQQHIQRNSSAANGAVEDAAATAQQHQEEEEDTALFAEESVRARGGLQMREKVISTTGVKGPVADIAISGLAAWVTVLSPGTLGKIRLRIWAPRGVEVFVRPALPVGGLADYKPDPLSPDLD